MSHVLLWQPSECVRLIVNCVVFFLENKYDDDDLINRHFHVFTIPYAMHVAQIKYIDLGLHRNNVYCTLLSPVRLCRKIYNSSSQAAQNCIPRDVQVSTPQHQKFGLGLCLVPLASVLDLTSGRTRNTVALRSWPRIQRPLIT